MLVSSGSSNGNGSSSSLQQHHQQQQHHVTSGNGQPHDDEMLALSLSECAADDVAGASTVERHVHGTDTNSMHESEDDSSGARRRSHFESSMESFAAANGLSTATETNHHSHDDLTPLAMPSSPSLLQQLTGSPTAVGPHAQYHHPHHQHHTHHTHVNAHHAQQQHLHSHITQQYQHQHAHVHHAQQQQARQNHALGSLSMAMLSHGALSDASAVQAYFQQHDADAVLAASVSTFSREFSELQKSVAGLDERRLADALSDKLASTPAPAASLPVLPAATTATKKRKGGANVSIDLQTKIRLIELAEEYQYDPKAAVRVKSESSSAGPGAKESISGIRLAAQFGLNKSTVSRILKRKDEYKKAYYKDNISGGSKHINKKSKFEKLNRLVENWFDMAREKQAAVSDTLIRDVGKRFAEELGVDDFRASNGWVRSLRNRKETQTRHLSADALAREQRKKDAEAVERMRVVFPNGLKDLSSFFKDLSTFLEQDCGAAAVATHELASLRAAANSVGSDSAGGTGSVHVGSGMTTTYSDLIDDALKDDDRAADECLRKKMVDALRTWSHELVEAELSRLKKRLKPRQVANL